jgi:hypothetical protein
LPLSTGAPGVSAADLHRIPFGVDLLYIVNREVDVGAAFQFDDVFKHSITVGTVSGDTGGFDYRSAALYARLRLRVSGKAAADKR